MKLAELLFDEQILRRIIREEVRAAIRDNEDEPLLTTRELSKAVKRSPGTIRRMVKDGRLTDHSTNGHPLYKLSEFTRTPPESVSR